VTAGVLGLDLLIGAATVIAAIVAARLAHSAGLPALLVFLGLGLALGEAGIGIRFDNAGLAEVLGLGALMLILAEGGLTTNWAVSIGVTAAFTHWMLGLTWREALLLGAVLAPTTAAAVFSVLRRLPLPPLLSGILEGESGLNDPPSVLAVTLLSQSGRHGTSPVLIVGEVVWQLAARCTPAACCSATRGCRTARPPAVSPRASGGWPRSGCSSCSACSRRRPGCPRRSCPRSRPAWCWSCSLVWQRFS